MKKRTREIKYTREYAEETKQTVNTESRRTNRESGKRKKKFDLGITITNLINHTSVSGIWDEIICFFPVIPSNFFI